VNAAGPLAPLFRDLRLKSCLKPSAFAVLCGGPTPGFAPPKPRPPAKWFSSFVIGRLQRPFLRARAHANVTQSMSAMSHLPDPYCVKRNTTARRGRMTVAAQHSEARGDRDMGHNDAEGSEKT
jgi:hypothetical protein